MLVQALSVLANSLRVPDLRRKIAYTAVLILVYRIGCYIPVPLIDTEQLGVYMDNLMRGGGAFNLVNLFTGGAFEKMTIFALGIMPYISVQIILQILTLVSPALEKLSKEGEIGRRTMNKYTRYGTVGLAAFQAAGLAMWLLQPEMGVSLKLPGVWAPFFVFTAIVAITTGTCFIMWLGERITEDGIGNGISLIIALGIVASYPSEIFLLLSSVFAPGEDSIISPLWAVIAIFLLLSVTWGIIMVQEGARRVPVQHARRVVGRRVMGGQANVLPLKVNTAGVIPVIFSSAILSAPSLIFAGLAGGSPSGFWGFLGELFNFESRYSLHMLIPGFNSLMAAIGLGFVSLPETGVFLLLKSFNLWMILFAGLTVFFSFFYTMVAFNPLDVADNLKKAGSFVPGYRPGKPTAQFIEFVITRITVIGAVFLVTVAILPYVLVISFGMNAMLMNITGGTGLIIVVGVMLQTVQALEAQLLTHNYEGMRTRKRRRGEIGVDDAGDSSLARRAILGGAPRRTSV